MYAQQAGQVYPPQLASVPMLAGPQGSFVAAPAGAYVQPVPQLAQPAQAAKGVKRHTEEEDGELDEIDLEEAIDQVGVGWSHFIVYIIVGLFTAADSVEVGFIGYVTEWLEGDWNLQEADKALMESMVFAGQILGAPVWGMLADNRGRRPVFLVSAVLISAFGFITALAPSKEYMIPIRFVVGFGVAGLSVPFDIFAEMLPSAARGKYLMATFFWFAIGSFYTTFAAWATLEKYGWQAFTCAAALPTTIATIAGIFLLPESAHWLASEGRPEEAAQVMNTVARRNGSPLRFEKCTVPEVLENLGTKDLLTHSKLRKPFFMMALVWLSFGVAFYGIGFLLPRILQNEGGGDNDSGGNVTVRLVNGLTFTTRVIHEREVGEGPTKHKEVDFDFVALMGPNLGQAFGLLIGLSLVDTAGRKVVQQASYVISGIFTIGLGFPSLGKQTLSILSSLALMAQMSASCCTWTHTPELFPTKVRGVANALCNSFARFGAAMSPFLVSELIPMLPTACIMAGFSFMGAIAVSFVKETAGAALDDEDVESSLDSDE